MVFSTLLIYLIINCVVGYASSSSDSEMEITTKFKTPTQANVKSSNFSSRNNKECILPEGR